MIDLADLWLLLTEVAALARLILSASSSCDAKTVSKFSGLKLLSEEFLSVDGSLLFFYHPAVFSHDYHPVQIQFSHQVN